MCAFCLLKANVQVTGGREREVRLIGTTLNGGTLENIRIH